MWICWCFKVIRCSAQKTRTTTHTRMLPRVHKPTKVITAMGQIPHSTECICKMFLNTTCTAYYYENSEDLFRFQKPVMYGNCILSHCVCYLFLQRHWRLIVIVCMCGALVCACDICCSLIYSFSSCLLLTYFCRTVCVCFWFWLCMWALTFTGKLGISY